jgi:hypothetical protein
LEAAIRKQIATLSSTRVLAENPVQAPKPKATATTANPTPSTAGEVPMLSVRRLMPSECEILQGFPAGWTAIDTAP